MSEPVGYQANAAHKTVSEVTCQRLLSLLLRSAAIDSGTATEAQFGTATSFTRDVIELIQSDNALQVWLQRIRPSEPAGDVSLDSPQFADSITEQIAASSQLIPCSDSLLAKNIHDAAHLAARSRATQASVSKSLEASKQQAIYNFAYGLSHELNNPLANISTRAGLLSRQSTSPRERQMLDAIVENAMRGCEMLGDLMIMARLPELDLQEVVADDFLCSLVRDSSVWAENFRVTIETDFEFMGCLHIDRRAMREACWSLIRNAIESGCDSITLRTQRISDAQIELRINDNGPGLSPEGLRNCFDPFYSGREAGRGLGLGLCKAKRIITLHNGELRIENLPTMGCSAIVALPA